MPAKPALQATYGIVDPKILAYQGYLQLGLHWAEFSIRLYNIGARFDSLIVFFFSPITIADMRR
jgi:hypothetical protein